MSAEERFVFAMLVTPESWCESAQLRLRTACRADLESAGLYNRTEASVHVPG